jgi:glycosyltransferase involved in cell wall biosynthesis
MMRIGIVPHVHRRDGGMFQYSETLVHTLAGFTSQVECQDEYVLFSSEAHHAALTLPKRQQWHQTPLVPSSVWHRPMHALKQLVGEGPHREAWRWLRRRFQRLCGNLSGGSAESPPSPATFAEPYAPRFQAAMHRRLRRARIDLLLCPGTNVEPFEYGIPYVMAVHDLQHRIQPEFPEVSANGAWEKREYYYRNAVRLATLVVAPSEVGKEEILDCYGDYGVTADRVKVLPYLPAHYLGTEVPQSDCQRVRARYRLPSRYLFYPSTFWPHKNHLRIVQALEVVRCEHQLEVPVVFCGPCSPYALRERVFQEVMEYAQTAGIADLIHHLDYVPDEEMSAFYAGAEALIMPTFFGPTALPPVEAWSLGCPVITSDIRGIREQMGDAALLVDPRSVESIAKGIARIWKEQVLRQELVARGRQRLASYTPSDFAECLQGILEEAKDRVRCAHKPRIVVTHS